jgi:hypothetical protein
MDEALQDWRGNELGVFSTVILSPHGPGTWAIGKVVEVYPVPFGSWVIDVEWSESTDDTWIGRTSRGIFPSDVTVFREGPN